MIMPRKPLSLQAGIYPMVSFIRSGIDPMVSFIRAGIDPMVSFIRSGIYPMVSFIRSGIDLMVSFIRGRKRLPGYRHFHPGGAMFSRFEISEIVLVSWKIEAGKYYMS